VPSIRHPPTTWKLNVPACVESQEQHGLAAAPTRYSKLKKKLYSRGWGTQGEEVLRSVSSDPSDSVALYDESDRNPDIEAQGILEGGGLGDRWVTDPVISPILASYMTYARRWWWHWHPIPLLYLSLGLRLSRRKTVLSGWYSSHPNRIYTASRLHKWYRVTTLRSPFLPRIKRRYFNSIKTLATLLYPYIRRQTHLLVLCMHEQMEQWLSLSCNQLDCDLATAFPKATEWIQEVIRSMTPRFLSMSPHASHTWKPHSRRGYLGYRRSIVASLTWSRRYTAYTRRKCRFWSRRCQRQWSTSKQRHTIQPKARKAESTVAFWRILRYLVSYRDFIVGCW
jgi:hypothetical protein